MNDSEIKTLVTLTRESMDLTRMLMESQGEITPDIEKMLEINKDNLLQKVDNYVSFTNYLDAQCKYWAELEAEARQVRTRLSSSMEQIKIRVKMVMTEMGVTDLDGGMYRYKLSNVRAKVVIEEPNAIPADLTKQTISIEPDKDLIRQRLDSGIDVPGAKLEEVKSLRVYTK